MLLLSTHCTNNFINRHWSCRQKRKESIRVGWWRCRFKWPSWAWRSRASKVFVIIRSKNSILISLRLWEKELSQAIEQQERQLRYMTENSDGLGYVTCKDIRSIFNNKMVLCIKVPIESEARKYSLFRLHQTQSYKYPNQLRAFKCFWSRQEAQLSAIYAQKQISKQTQK